MIEGSADDVEATLPAHSGTGPGAPSEIVTLPRGRVVGRYVVVQKLGAGGMGVVYRAYDPELDRVVALKLLHRHDSRTGSHGEVRLLREAQAMARLSHPNVIVVHDVGTHDDQVFIAMEFVDGRTLGDWVEHTEPSWRAVLALFLRAGEGLAAAHRAQLVHRDFKPENVLVGNDGRLRVLDFGLVQFSGQADDSSDFEAFDVPSSTLSVSLTQTGTVMGTPSYMSPEQIAGKTATEQSDQFSFCVALYEALYGERPFVADSLAELYHAIANDPVPEPPSGSPVPGWVRRVLVRGLDKSPDGRFSSMESLLAALRRDPARVRRRVLLGAGVVAVSVGVGVAAAELGDDLPTPCTGAEGRLGEVWGDAQRAALVAAFGDEPAFAAAAADKAVGQLDAYAEQWVTLHRAACMTAVRGESSAAFLDLQMGCLGDRLQSLRGAVEVLTEADAQTVRNSDRVVRGLPPLPRCADAESLQSELIPPQDVAELAEFKRLRARIADGKATHDAGKIKRAAEISDEILVAARALGHQALLARALHDAGTGAEDLGDLERAATLLEESYNLALQTRQDRVAGAAANTLALVLGIRQGKWELATVWERAALSMARRNDGGGVAEANVLASMAEHARLTGDLQQAEEHARAAYDIAVERTGERSLKTAERAQQLAFIVGARGRADDGLALARLALDINTERLGAEHPDVAGTLAIVGILLGDLGRSEEKLETLARSVEISSAVYGRRSRAVASALTNMANAAREVGRPDQARDYIEEALDIDRELFGDSHPKVGGAMMLLGLLADDAGKLDQARTHYNRCIEIFEAAYGEQHPAVAGALHNLAGIHSQEENYVEAYAGFERSLKIAEAVLGSDHPQTTMTRTDLGATLVSLGRATEALPHLREALKQRLAEAGDPRDLAHTRLALASALWDSGERQEAMALARKAERIYIERPELHDPRADEIRDWIQQHAS